MTTATDASLRFLVCAECGPIGLFQKLLALAERCEQMGVDIDVREAPCLSACRFSHVVKVQEITGKVHCYSARERNGFRRLSDDPLQDLIHQHLPELGA